MKTFLFAWNPNKWEWSNQKNLIAQLPKQKPVQVWATVSIKNIQIGDRFLLVKVGNIDKLEKGIIGSGSIISHPYKDKDFLKNAKIRHFVKLKFDLLSDTTFISLNELEAVFPNQKWTIQGSGILIKENYIADEIFFRMHQKQDFQINELKYEKRIFFPIVSEEVDQILIHQDSVYSDEIVKNLLEKHAISLERIAKNKNTNSLLVAQNMVDWFSAELSKDSDIVALRQEKYERNKVTINGREITQFSLALNSEQDEVFPENIQYKEGIVKQITVNAYERNSKARQKCLEKMGYTCQCCNFNFEKKYGEIGKNFIHVHHRIPISNIKREYELNPEIDLVPVCANCHAIIHRKNPPYTIEQVKEMLTS